MEHSVESGEHVFFKKSKIIGKSKFLLSVSKNLLRGRKEQFPLASNLREPAALKREFNN